MVWRWFSLASGVGLLIGLFVCSGLRSLVCDLFCFLWVGVGTSSLGLFGL